MVDDDVLRVVQVAGERDDIRTRELVGAVDGFVFTVCPEDPILKTEPNMADFYTELIIISVIHYSDD